MQLVISLRTRFHYRARAELVCNLQMNCPRLYFLHLYVYMCIFVYLCFLCFYVIEFVYLHLSFCVIFFFVYLHLCICFCICVFVFVYLYLCICLFSFKLRCLTLRYCYALRPVPSIILKMLSLLHLVSNSYAAAALNLYH